MSAVRHHTVSRFLLGRFARETPHGARVCQLEIATGRPRQIGPRDATIRKHFYSIDIDAGRSPAVEEALGMIENGAAPLVRQLAEGNLPEGASRLELALFMTMSSLRTPLWREQTKSVAEQFETAWWAETNRAKDVSAIRAAFAGTHWEAMSDEELKAFRDEMIHDIDSGKVSVELPVNNLIKLFLNQDVPLRVGVCSEIQFVRERLMRDGFRPSAFVSGHQFDPFFVGQLRQCLCEFPQRLEFVGMRRGEDAERRIERDEHLRVGRGHDPGCAARVGRGRVIP
jgi:hypothetical protein